MAENSRNSESWWSAVTRTSPTARSRSGSWRLSLTVSTIACGAPANGEFSHPKLASVGRDLFPAVLSRRGSLRLALIRPFARHCVRQRGQELGAEAHGRLPSRPGRPPPRQRAGHQRRRDHVGCASCDGRRGRPRRPRPEWTPRDHDPSRRDARRTLRARREDAGVDRRAWPFARPLRHCQGLDAWRRRLRVPSDRLPPERVRGPRSHFRGRARLCGRALRPARRHADRAPVPEPHRDRQHPDGCCARPGHDCDRECRPGT